MQPPSSSLPSSARRAGWFADLSWWLFCIWTAIGFVVMPLGIGPETVDHLLPAGVPRESLDALLHVSDAIWIYLAAVVVYLHTAASEGLATARQWALILLFGSGAAEWIGAQTGFPFGSYRYTDHFGWRIGEVLPVAIPLAWTVVILCGRALILRLRPAASRLELALGVAIIATLTDVNLEAVAWKIRGYWQWYPDQTGPLPAWPPIQNYVAWLVLSFGLAALLPPNYALRMRKVSPRRPILVLALMNALFVVVYVARWWRVRM